MPYDPFIPELQAGTPPALTTPQQRQYIHDILEKACSDSFFAAKAEKAILLVLAAGLDGTGTTPPPPDVLPIVTSLSPNTIAIGAPDFTLHVMGSDFVPTSQIFIKDVVAPTIYVSPTELTTTIDMALVVTPGVANVTVKSGALVSAALPFTVTV